MMAVECLDNKDDGVNSKNTMNGYYSSKYVSINSIDFRKVGGRTDTLKCVRAHCRGIGFAFGKVS